jgi:hypothetical protein
MQNYSAPQSKVDKLSLHTEPENSKFGSISNSQTLFSEFNSNGKLFDEKNVLPHQPWKDYSTYFLLIVNLISIVWAVVEGWGLPALMWVYWIQSVTIGFTNLIRMWTAKNFSVEGIKFSGEKLPPTKASQTKLSLFFLAHYGGIHFLYASFLAFLSLRSNFILSFDLIWVVVAGLLFAGNHLFSFFYNKPRESGKVKLATLMVYPYARILPMHATIILAIGIVGEKTGLLIIFMSLKTISDVIMHIIEHNFYNKQVQENYPATENQKI